MDYKRFNKLVDISMNHQNDNLVLNLGVNGQVSFDVNEEQPWAYVKIVHTDIGSHPVMQCFEDFEDVLDVISDHITEAKSVNLGPFINLNISIFEKEICAQALFYCLNTHNLTLEVKEIYVIAEINKL